jgi:hypothetical protein
MRDEVEEFLRRAAARRAQAEAKRREQQQQPPLQPQAPRPQAIQRPPLRQLPPQRVDDAEVIDAEVADTSSRFNSSVSQNLRGTSDIARHASSLGAEVDQADDKLEARLHKTFDHQIGRLKDTTTAAPVREAMQTSDDLLASMNLTKLLTNAQSIRNAIILSEVLNRPEHRWE